MTPFEGEEITVFAERLGYPSVQVFMMENVSDIGVSKSKSGKDIPWVYPDRDYPEYTGSQPDIPETVPEYPGVPLIDVAKDEAKAGLEASGGGQLDDYITRPGLTPEEIEEAERKAKEREAREAREEPGFFDKLGGLVSEGVDAAGDFITDVKEKSLNFVGYGTDKDGEIVEAEKELSGTHKVLKHIADEPDLTGVTDVIEEKGGKWLEKEGARLSEEELKKIADAKEKEKEEAAKFLKEAKPAEKITDTVVEVTDTGEKKPDVTGPGSLSSTVKAREVVGSTITNKKVKDVWDDIIANEEANIEDWGYTSFFFEEEEERYRRLADELENEITGYEDKIMAVGAETMAPVFEGANKFWAVIAAALGAGASTMAGTPNFALQIINKTIDTELEKFLRSRDIRKQTAERQQLNLITKRGELLRTAEKAADSAMAALSQRDDAQNRLATVTRIKETIAQESDKNEQDFLLRVGALFMEEAKMKLTARIEYGKKYVEGLTALDNTGQRVIFTPAKGRTDDDVKVMKKMRTLVDKTIRELDKLDVLLYGTPENKEKGKINPAIYAPASVSDTRAALDKIAGNLELTYKELYNMGAHYTVIEQLLVRSQIPKIHNEITDAWLGKIGVRAKLFRTSTLQDYATNYKTHTEGGSTNLETQRTIYGDKGRNRGPTGPPPKGKVHLVKEG